MKLFNDMSYSQRLNHIEKLQYEALKCIEAGETSQLADIADHLDIWGPWMLRELRHLLALSKSELTNMQMPNFDI